MFCYNPDQPCWLFVGAQFNLKQCEYELDFGLFTLHHEVDSEPVKPLSKQEAVKHVGGSDVTANGSLVNGEVAAGVNRCSRNVVRHVCAGNHRSD